MASKTANVKDLLGTEKDSASVEKLVLLVPPRDRQNAPVVLVHHVRRLHRHDGALVCHRVRHAKRLVDLENTPWDARALATDKKPVNVTDCIVRNAEAVEQKKDNHVGWWRMEVSVLGRQ